MIQLKYEDEDMYITETEKFTLYLKISRIYFTLIHKKPAITTSHHFLFVTLGMVTQVYDLN